MNIWHDMHPDLIRKEEYTVFTANSMGSTAVLAFDGSTGLLQLEHLSDPYVAAICRAPIQKMVCRLKP